MPRYPFTPELLDAIPEELAEIFRGLEMTLLQEICSRLKISDNLNEVTVADIKALRSHGIDLEDIKKAIAETADVSMDKLNKLFDDVLERNQAYYTEMIDLAKVTDPDMLVNARDVEAIRKQTADDFHNITQSMGFLVDSGRTMLPPAKAYQWALDSAVIQIESGAISYNDAVAGAVKQLADSGLKMVNYESGHIDSVDVAARRAVMTGVNQINQKYREQSMDYLDTDLVEVTAHRGARDIDGPMGWENHKAWQGKVYRWKRDGLTNEVDRPTEKKTIAMKKQEPKPKMALGSQDVTQEYMNTALPGQGRITYDKSFDKEKHANEVKLSEWLHRVFGGDIHLLNEINQNKVHTPDYIWSGKFWDLKTVTTEKAADAAIRHGLKQINENPGGIFLDYRGKEIDVPKLQAVIDSRMRHSSANSVDIMVILSDAAIKVFRYKK